jgi:hypothetical protein
MAHKWCPFIRVLCVVVLGAIATQYDFSLSQNDKTRRNDVQDFSMTPDMLWPINGV